MKMLLPLLLATGMAGSTKCCDPRHDLLATGINRIEECRLAGGVAVTSVVVDESGHAFIQLARCDFPIPLQREHKLPNIQQRAAESEQELGG